MELPIYTDKHFELDEAIKAGMFPAEFDGCHFKKINLSQWDLSKTVFIDCLFTDCNLCGARIVKTAFKGIKFRNCKMTGLHFDQADPFLFEVDFEDCQLELSSFYKCQLKKTRFARTLLKEVDFTDANLGEAVFDHADLSLATFDNTFLEKADLRTALNYTIDPQKNKIRKIKCSYPGVLGFMDHLDITIE